MTQDFERTKVDIGSRVVSSAALLWGTNLGLRAMQLLTTAVLARLLSPEDYGIVALAAVYIGLLDVISNLQLGSAIIRTKELDGSHLDTAFTIDFFRSILISVLMIFSASAISNYMNEPRLENVIYALSASSLITGLSNPYFLLYQRDLNFQKESVRLFIASASATVIGIAVAVIFRSYWALVAATIATSLANVGLSYWGPKHRPSFSIKRFYELFSFGSWFLLINVLNYINGRVEYSLIGRYLGPQELGSYHIGQQVITSTTGDMVAPLSKAIFPAFSMIADEPDRLKESYRRAQVIIVALSLPIGFGVSLLAEEIVLVLVGTQWRDAIIVVTILAPLIALQTVNAGVESAAFALGRSKTLFYRTLFFLIIRSGAMIGGFYLGGFLGIVYGRIISGGFNLIYGLALGASLTNSSTLAPFAASWRSFIAAAAMIASLTFVKFPPPVDAFLMLAFTLAWKIALGATVYTAVHLALWFAASCPEGAETALLRHGKRLISRRTKELKTKKH